MLNLWFTAEDWSRSLIPLREFKNLGGESDPKISSAPQNYLTDKQKIGRRSRATVPVISDMLEELKTSLNLVNRTRSNYTETTDGYARKGDTSLNPLPPLAAYSFDPLQPLHRLQPFSKVATSFALPLAPPAPSNSSNLILNSPNPSNGPSP